MIRPRGVVGAVCVGVLVWGCATSPETGVIAGRWTPPGKAPQPVVISWESRDAITGSMFLTLGKGGERFTGDFLRVTSGTDLGGLEPILGPWNAIRESGGWAQEADPWWWGPPGAGPLGIGWDGAYFPEFVRQYSGKVVATLSGNRGHKMRCRFTLAQPREGLMGGGTGECESSTGGRVSARF